MNKIIDRIEREAGVPGLASILAERLTPTDLQSLLLEVVRLRAAQLTPPQVLSAYETNRFARPSTTPPAALTDWERIAFAQLPPDFEALALSPVCPLGTNSVVAPVTQNWSVATVRNTEVVSDATNVLALEAALRRRDLLRADPKSTGPVHLAASHRLLRAQRFSGPRQVTHFSLFALCSAGRALGSRRFELETLGRHARFYLEVLRAYLGPYAPLRFALTDFSGQNRRARLEEELLSPLQAEFESATFEVDDAREAGQGYYPGLCFHIYAKTLAGESIELVDGGVVDWTQRLLSDAKERTVTSGIGSERLCMVFGEGRET